MNEAYAFANWLLQNTLTWVSVTFGITLASVIMLMVAEYADFWDR